MAGIAFRPVDPSAFNRRYNTIPAGPALQYLIAENVFAKFKFFRAVKLALVKSSLCLVLAETIAGSGLCRSSR